MRPLFLFVLIFLTFTLGAQELESNGSKPIGKIDLSGLKISCGVKEEEIEPLVGCIRPEKLPVYPGCEEFKGNNRELISCFGQKLSIDVMNFLDQEYPDDSISIQKRQLVALIEFHVNEEGEIVNVQAKAGDNAMKPKAKQALNRTAEWLKLNGQIIEPATMEDGTKATLIFQTKIGLSNPDWKEPVVPIPSSLKK